MPVIFHNALCQSSLDCRWYHRRRTGEPSAHCAAFVAFCDHTSSLLLMSTSNAAYPAILCLLRHDFIFINAFSVNQIEKFNLKKFLGFNTEIFTWISLRSEHHFFKVRKLIRLKLDNPRLEIPLYWPVWFLFNVSAGNLHRRFQCCEHGS